MPTYDESGHWMWDEASGQWVPAEGAPAATAPAATLAPPPPSPQAEEPAAAPPATATAVAPPPHPPGGYAPAGTGTPGPPPKKRRTGLIVLIVVLVICAILALCGLVGGVLYTFSAGNKPVTNGASGGTGTQGSSSGKATGRYGTPDAVITAWYKAVAEGDMGALKSLATTNLAGQIDGGMFEGRDPVTEYRIVGGSAPPANSKPGDMEFVDVQETTGGEKAKTNVTFQVLKTENGYLIAGYSVTAAPDSGTSGETGEQTTGTKTGEVIGKNAAIDVVGRILDARKNSRVAEARSLATPRFQKDAPVFFTPSSNAFTNFEVDSATFKNGAWYVQAKEDWISGPEDATYTVVTVNGRGLVDSWETAAQ